MPAGPKPALNLLETWHAIHVRTPASVLNFVYANSYLRNVIHKTFLCMKNRKFVHKYMHVLKDKDNELMKLT